MFADLHLDTRDDPSRGSDSPHSFVRRPRHNVCVIGTERHTGDLIGVPLNDLAAVSRDQVPYPEANQNNTAEFSQFCSIFVGQDGQVGAIVAAMHPVR